MNPKKILVIDDNPVIIRLNESLLVSQGYEIISAMNGVDGLKKAQEQKPDVILLDLILPEMHGFEVCQQLKNNDTTKDIPVIIITGSGLEDVAREEPSINAQGYLAKPYGAQELNDAISKVLPAK